MPAVRTLTAARLTTALKAVRAHLDLSPRSLALAACTHPEAPPAAQWHGVERQRSAERD